MNLTHDAMLVSLRINSWSGRLYDRQASQQVAVHNDADTSAGRYNKRLLPKQAFAALAATMSNARTSHYANTLPWDDQGGRLLTVANYERYTTALDTLVERVVRERARFIEDYDDYVDQARLDLGRLFRLEDYPGTEALQGKFAIRYRIVPVPDARHFMADLAQGETERVKRDIEQQVRTRLNDAQRDLYRRLGEAVERVGERLREDENGKPLVFRDSLIENIRELVDVVPRLNIFADDDLTMLCRRGEGQVRRYRARRPAPLGPLRSQPPPAGQARRRCAHGAIRGLLRARRREQGSSMMAARSESARRVSDCVTALLRDQPFFGSLALRLPIRADETRETLASDGKDIRYAPQWVADTDADHIKTALARVVLACALKHHTRRGGRDPERWQRASQLVTHGLLRDAGFVLPPEAEAWDGISAEQAYDRLPEPSDDAEDPGDASSSSDADDSGSAAGPQCGDGDEDQSAPSIPPATTVRKSRTSRDRAAIARARNHPGKCPPATTPAAPARSWTRTSARRRHRPVRRIAGGHARRGAGVGRGHAPGREPRTGARQRAGRGRGDDPASASQHPRLAVAIAPLHDRCRAPRL